MGRILAVDYGRKRTGLAVTDPLCRIATPLATVATCDLLPYLASYMSREPVDLLVMGRPLQLNGQPSETEKRFVEPAVKQLRRQFPGLQVELMDERYTSKMAFRSMIDGGLHKKDRQEKGTIDRVSAALLLQSYMTQQQMAAERASAAAETPAPPENTSL